jgi:RES domain-containing protein
MEVYRLSVSAYADLSGAGGLYGAARWHKKGAPILYTASSRSLSALERFVHEDVNTMPKLTMMTIWVPDNVSLKRLNNNDLPKYWDLLPPSTQSQNVGSQWLLEKETLALQLPSAIIGQEYNYLFNPMHPEASQLKIVDKTDYFYDQRLGKMIR